MSDTFLLSFSFQILSDELGCRIDDIASIELNVCDTQPSCLGGANNEFIFSGRLDNLASSFCALRALIDSSASPEDLSNEHAVRMVALFDNEEVSFIFFYLTFIRDIASFNYMVICTISYHQYKRITGCRPLLQHNTLSVSALCSAELTKYVPHSPSLPEKDLWMVYVLACYGSCRFTHAKEYASSQS